MYLPKHQYIITKLADLTGFDVLLDKQGNTITDKNTEIIQVSNGMVLSKKGADLDTGDFSNAVRLFPLPSNESAEESPNQIGYLGQGSLGSQDRVLSTKIPPTSTEIQAGTMKRYIYYNKCTGKVKEIIKGRYDLLKADKTKCEHIDEVDWVLQGQADDATLNGHFLQGVRSINTKAIETLRQTIPQIDQILQDPLEYVNEIQIPGSLPIQQKQPNFYIPSPSKKL